MKEKAIEFRNQLIEAIADSDDDVMNAFLEGEEILALRRSSEALRKATIAMNVFPVLCGSSFKNKGRADAARCGGGVPAKPAGCAGDRRVEPGQHGREEAAAGR